MHSFLTLQTLPLSSLLVLLVVFFQTTPTNASPRRVSPIPIPSTSNTWDLACIDAHLPSGGTTACAFTLSTSCTLDGLVTIPGFTPPGSNVCSDPSLDVEYVSPELCYCACACMVPGSPAEAQRGADGASPVRVIVGGGM